jgi:hypothetical protein
MSLSIFDPPEPELPASPAYSPCRPAETRLSAGRAWLFSMLLPGMGQIYCGATTRGGAMAVVSVVAIGASFAWREAVDVALRALVIFYTLAPLDACFTAREHNAGIDVEAPDNPRVAALLNLTTNGFGYLYTGAREIVWPVFVVGIIGRSIGTKFPLLVELFFAAIAFHAWKIATRNGRLIISASTASTRPTTR